MNPTQSFQLFLSLKLHFSKPSYDWFRYQGQLKYIPDISKRRDRYQFEKLSRHVDSQGILLSNLSVNPNAWIIDILSDKGMTTYKNWKKRIDSLDYTFQQEIKKLLPNFNSNFVVPKHEHPYALRLFLGEHISLETLTILNRILRFYPTWDKEMNDDIVWKEVRYQIPKYSPFLKSNMEKHKAILIEQFNV